MKKKSSLIIISLLLILSGLSVYLYLAKSNPTTVDEDARNFRYKDTFEISRIFIADKDGHAADLKRLKTGWVVNDKYSCRNDAILNLLEVIKLVEVKMPVPKAQRETVLKYMATQALKVELYKGDKLVKQYYVGHESGDSEGSHMLLTNVKNGKNYKDPFICFIPGFKGYLLPRFITNENEWRDRIVMNYIPPQLKQVSVRNFEAPADSSFTINLLNTNSFELTNGKGAKLSFDDEKMRQYLVYLQNISYEVLLTGKNKKLQDSLLVVKPFTTITITSTNGKADTYNFYRKQFMGNINPEHGVTYDHDPDRLYLSFENNQEWALIQYFVFGKMLVSTNYFTPDKSVKK